MVSIKHTLIIAGAITFLMSAGSCRKNPVDSTDNGKPGVDSLSYNADWTYLSHGNAPPDYAAVFPQESVNTIEITMGTEAWGIIRSNMKSLLGFDFGGNTAGGGGGLPDINPNYVDVAIKYNNKIWKNVGFRLKGASSLAQAWGEGIYKLPFKLNFDKFEDVYPGVTNQHFYGFKELVFSPSFRDQSLLKEKITADIFRMAGVPAAQTAFYRVYIDFGSGLKYCGIYTAIELPDDNMVKSQFGEKSENLYKPESQLISFTREEFEKKNNKEAADYSDVQSFIAALNSPIRTSNPAQWRTSLEEVFNVSHFLKYLAVSNAIVNWDSYGNRAHNYYLYNHSSNKLTWIPWDHNEALSGSPGITGTSPGNGTTGLSLSMNEVAGTWPLLRHLADDAVYLSAYKENLKSFKNYLFTENAMNSLLDKYHNLISPYVIGANGEQTGYTYLINSSSFQNALAELKTHISDRRALITAYVP